MILTKKVKIALIASLILIVLIAGSVGSLYIYAGNQVTDDLTTKSTKVPIVWIVGGPGSGKGTQCANIVEKFGFSHYSTGDLVRAEIASGTEKGKEFEEIVKRGDLISNDDVLDLLKDAIQKDADNSKGSLIDGYPREKSQGLAFEKSIAPVDLIISIECKPETLLNRILKRANESDKKRADDNETTVKRRIEIFTKTADEILKQYPTKTKRIDGERDVDSVFQDVSEAISKLIANEV